MLLFRWFPIATVCSSSQKPFNHHCTYQPIALNGNCSLLNMMISFQQHLSAKPQTSSCVMTILGIRTQRVHVKRLSSAARSDRHGLGREEAYDDFR